MKRIWLILATAAVVAAFAGCGSGDGGDGPTITQTSSTPDGSTTPPNASTSDGSTTAPSASTSDGSTSATIQLVITNDSSMIDLEDEELSPILDRIAPALVNRLANSGLPAADVQRIGPRSIVVQIEGEAETVVPQVQQLIAEGNFEIPLIVIQLQQ